MSICCPQVKVPTLVLHCRDDAVAPFEEGARMAAGIPGARFVALEGQITLSWRESRLGQFLDEIKEFLET